MKKQKLVRDKIPEIYSLKERHIANDEEFLKELLKKLQEEVDEFKDGKNIEELVDITEVIYALSEFYGKSIKELEKMRVKKLKEKGGFKKHLIWENDKM